MNRLLSEILDIDFPVIQAPMAGVQDAKLAAAVCQAGGLGSLPAAMLSPEQLTAQLDKLRTLNRPYNVNFFCHKEPKADLDKERRWQGVLKKYYQEYGIESTETNPGASRQPFSEETAHLLEIYQPAVVSFHFGLPHSSLIEKVKNWGSKVISTATTVEEALWLEQNGADLIIAQGLEAGGHRGLFLSPELTRQVGTLPLVSQILDAVTLPVIAAGGIAGAEGVKAMLALGAAGVQIGTAYLLCDEATTSTLHRQALKGAGAGHTAITNLFTGRPARGIVNRVIREIGPMNPHAPTFPRASAALAPLREAAEKLGKNEFTPLWSGQNNTGCKEISAITMTQELMALIHRK